MKDEYVIVAAGVAALATMYIYNKTTMHKEKLDIETGYSVQTPVQTNMIGRNENVITLPYFDKRDTFLESATTAFPDSATEFTPIFRQQYYRGRSELPANQEPEIGNVRSYHPDLSRAEVLKHITLKKTDFLNAQGKIPESYTNAERVWPTDKTQHTANRTGIPYLQHNIRKNGGTSGSRNSFTPYAATTSVAPSRQLESQLKRRDIQMTRAPQLTNHQINAPIAKPETSIPRRRVEGYKPRASKHIDADMAPRLTNRYEQKPRRKETIDGRKPIAHAQKDVLGVAGLESTHKIRQVYESRQIKPIAAEYTQWNKPYTQRGIDKEGAVTQF